MVTAGATANTTVKNSRASRESGLGLGVNPAVNPPLPWSALTATATTASATAAAVATAPALTAAEAAARVKVARAAAARVVEVRVAGAREAATVAAATEPWSQPAGHWAQQAWTSTGTHAADTAGGYQRSPQRGSAARDDGAVVEMYTDDVLDSDEYGD